MAKVLNVVEVAWSYMFPCVIAHRAILLNWKSLASGLATNLQHLERVGLLQLTKKYSTRNVPKSITTGKYVSLLDSRKVGTHLL